MIFKTETGIVNLLCNYDSSGKNELDYKYLLLMDDFPSGFRINTDTESLGMGLDMSQLDSIDTESMSTSRLSDTFVVEQVKQKSKEKKQVQFKLIL